MMVPCVRALAILVVMVGAAAAADRPEAMPQSAEALRGFSDRHDKFNHNYGDPLDAVNGHHAKKSRTALGQQQPQQPDEHHQADYYDSRAQQVNSRPRQSAQPAPSAAAANTRRYYDDYRYDQFDQYEGVNRNGNPAYSYSESSAAPYNTNNANRKTFSLGGKSGNLALVVSPLAGISFIAVAAAVAISPVYLTLSSSLFSGRKRRDLAAIVDPTLADKVTPEMMQKIQELQTLEKFLASVPKEADYQQQIMSMYLSCSGYTEEGNVCLDRVFCEYGNAESKISEEERDVLSIVLYNIMSNEFVPAEYKQRLRTAARLGRDFQQCSRYDCPALSQ